MRCLSYIIILFLLWSVQFYSQSRHGETLNYDCSSCHQSTTWEVDRIKMNFDHDSIGFKLAGQHQMVDCRSCHQTLIFEQASSDCFSCHKDIHQNTVGFDCAKCHSPESWIVKDISGIHQLSRFPLVGAHQAADCKQCHANFENLTFEPLGISCFECHQQNYINTTSPNHASAGFSTDCLECHSMNEIGWSAQNFNHDFFPLTGGHDISNCFSCHQQGGFTGLSTDCYSCHQEDYNTAVNPNHAAAGIPTDCNSCHQTSAWIPSTFNHTLTGFELQGAHAEIECSSCHAGSVTGQNADCISCHQDDYNSAPEHVTQNYPTTCTMCHNTIAWSPANFDHQLTAFPLTGAHNSVECSNCHTGGFAGTPTECVACHNDDYNASVNPSHTALSIPTDCQTCHTTNPNWEPAGFPIHNNYYELLGAHSAIASNCVTCHNGNYTATPNSCFGCHEDNYNATTNPPHAQSGFGTDCQVCHNQNAWTPATFDHDNLYFPIYSGRHQGEWTACSDCHTNPQNFAIFSCIDCHEHNQLDTDEKHLGITGYVYSSEACFACHPDGSAANAFNHNLSNFPLTGAHITLNCQQCHATGYTNTSTECVACHQNNYNATTNPNHQALSISTDCSTCHSTNPGWEPAQFPQHNQFFELTGRHAEIAGDCFSCHNGNYNSTPNQCAGCHQDSYNNAQNPNHTAAGIPTTCESCHTSTSWIPSTFSHINTGFELVGQHAVAECSSCHVGTVTGLTQDCISCHQANYNSAPNHVAQNYPVNCQLCHNSVAWTQVSFNHNNTNFPLTGAHISTECSMCHSTGYTGTTTICSDCHQAAYNASTNPSHTALAISTTCQNCHTTNPNWEPATFSIHNNYYALVGAHASIANQCFTCHQGNYNSTPNTCFGCHDDDYAATSNPNHQAAGFPTACENCHTQNAWTPATFDHDNLYFPIYSGRHQGEWNNCSDCHPDPGNFSIFTCTTACHPAGETNNQHVGVSGYVYQSSACLSCHPDGEEKFRTRLIEKY